MVLIMADNSKQLQELIERNQYISYALGLAHGGLHNLLTLAPEEMRDKALELYNEVGRHIDKIYYQNQSEHEE